MAWDLLIRNGDVVTPDGVRRADVAVEGDTIVELAPGLAGSAREELDATGLHVFPGLIDSHVHFNEPGRAEWEGIETGSAALAAGGGTAFFDMPLNSSPPVLDADAFDAKLAAARAKSCTDLALWGGLTPDNVDKLHELADRGVIGFKAFMSNSGIDDFPAADDYTLLRGMRVAAERELIVAVHAENDAITAGMARDADGRSYADYAASRPALAEVEAIRRAITLAAATGCKLHIVHVSSATGAIAARAGRAVANVSYETCPHYLLLTVDDLRTIGPRAKCAPPLRMPQHRDHLINALHRGEIDFVASDHSPSPESMKQGDDFFKIWGGVAGVQSTLPAMLSLDPPLPPDRVARYTAAAVAERFGVAGKGRVEVGFDADFALVDLSQTFELTRDTLLDRHKLSPYVGRRFNGVVRQTIVRGTTVFRDGAIVGRPQPRLLLPNGGGSR
jgi:allantoinase